LGRRGRGSYALRETRRHLATNGGFCPKKQNEERGKRGEKQRQREEGVEATASIYRGGGEKRARLRLGVYGVRKNPGGGTNAERKRGPVKGPLG